AVVSVHDEVKGEVPDLYVSLNPGEEPSEELARKISGAVSDVVGKIARPAHVYIVADMPKTRSGKIMRRVLASISNRKDVGDVMTLANPHIVEEIRQQVQG
ncbi:MAG: acetyl-coenzyme A synthetase, partial [Desulfohalobiaceae bacterium]